MSLRWKRLISSGNAVPLFGVFIIAGCASYEPSPLPRESGLSISTDALVRTLADAPSVVIANGVSMNEAAVIAVVTNPDLVAQRKRLGVAEAQIFSTRLLPDPQISLGREKPTGDDPALVDARTASRNYDLLALLTRSSNIRSQKLAGEQVRLEVVWQEWQVAQNTRLLFVRERAESLKLALLKAAVENFEKRRSMSHKALAEGNLTVEQASPDLTALLDAGSQLYQLQQQHTQTSHDLRALMGLVPDSTLDLVELPTAPASKPLDASAILPGLANRRPDLLALQAGYASQEARVRTAVLRFFPALVLGAVRANDTSSIYTSGINLSFALPLFTGNRGEVRVERATRERLRAEYQARLAQTQIDVSRLSSEQVILDERRTFLHKYIPELRRMAEESSKAYAARDIDALVYLNVKFTLINKRMELIDLEQSLWEIAIALDTITAQALTS